MADHTPKVVPLPLLRSEDNPHTNYPEFKDQLYSRAYGLYSVHDPTGAFSHVAPDSDWNFEPANVIPEIPAVPAQGGNAGTALVPARARARPNPVKATRSDQDTGRVAANKDLEDVRHTEWVQAAVDLKNLIVAAIGTEHCATIAATHPNGALRNCSARFIMDWIELEYGTIESHHITERLASLDVVLTSVDQWPAHAAFFATTIRRLRIAERRLPISIVPSDQNLFHRLKSSFANLREFDASMSTFMTSNCTIQSQTCERLTAFLKTQKGFIRSQATSAQFAGSSSQAPAPAPARQQQQQRRQPGKKQKNRNRRNQSPSPTTDTIVAALMSQFLQPQYPPMYPTLTQPAPSAPPGDFPLSTQPQYPQAPPHPYQPPPQNPQYHVHPHYGFAAPQPQQQQQQQQGLGIPKFCFVHGYTLSPRGHDGMGCNVMRNDPQ